MTAEIENLILEQLRRIHATVDITREDVSDLRLRMSAVESHAGQIRVQLAGMNSRVDRVEERLGRIERRLDLVDA
jgi:hypothetical protein